MKRNLVFTNIIFVWFVLNIHTCSAVTYEKNKGPGNYEKDKSAVNSEKNKNIVTTQPDTVGKKTSQIIINASVKKGNNDVVRLKYLASGVGWEFSPNPKTTAELKRVGIKSIRCINIETLPGKFMPDGSFSIGQPTRLLAHFGTCRNIGAIPHICLATALPPDLSSKDAGGSYGPTDWVRYRNYYKAFFKYVLIDQGFPQARFEVGNEPDIGGIFTLKGAKPANGSAAAYDAYFNMYRNIAQAATEFEKENPGSNVYLGGPALAWAYTFKFGSFNWSERFIKDVSEQKIKCDFIGLHYYGNMSSQNGEFSAATYPTFTQMLKVVSSAEAKYSLNKPIWMTEWGPSYHTDNSLPARINGDHVGAAWAANFLATMLQNNVGGAMFLVTTDFAQAKPNSPVENVWGWPSLFASPTSFSGNAYPKPIFHVFDMISRLDGDRVDVSSANRVPGVFGFVNAETGKVYVMVWNYNAFIPESGNPVDNSTEQSINILVKGLPNIFVKKAITISRWQVSEHDGNSTMLNAKGVKLTDQNTALPLVEKVNSNSNNSMLSYTFRIPPSGVCLIEFDVNDTR